MRIQISSNPPGPLKVIPELPDAPLAVLEGLNGIGKTLAVRLLQLCTGGFPYGGPDAPAWMSLCQGLGEFEVSATGLHGTSAIYWRGDSRDWTSLAGITDSALFREITINGRASSLDEVRKVVVVHRIAGDEGIVETLAREAEVAAERLRRWRRRHTSPETSPLGRLEAVAANFLDAFGELTAERYRQLENDASEAEASRLETHASLETAIQVRDRLVEMSRVRNALTRLESQTPDLLTRIESIDSTIAELHEERDKLQRQMVALAGTVAASEPVLRELRNARRTLDRNRSNLSHALSEAAALGAELDIEPDLVVVDTLLSQLTRRLDELRDEQVTLDAAPVMRQLLDGLSGELADAESQGLGDQTAIEEPETQVELSVAQTRVGMQTRRQFLEGQPPPPRAREVAEQLTAVEGLLARASHTRAVLLTVDRYRRLVGENEQRVDRALRATDPDAASKLQELEAQKRMKDEELVDLAAERASLRQQLGVLGGGETLEQLESQLAAAVQDAGVPLESLDEAIANAETNVAGAEQAWARADLHAAEARRELSRASADAKRLAGIVADSEAWAWLRRAVPETLVPSVNLPIPQQVQALDLIKRRLAATAERLGKHRDQVAGIENALRGVARHLRGDDPQADEYLPELQRSFGERFSRWFNNERVRRELLPAADGPITVDLEKRTVDWTTGAASHSRPLEAFSSGEQAFAYTRARLGVLDEEGPRPPNRLIVLDEFGAFIAHDLLDGLLAYIRDRSSEHPEDQVLVILPLNRDYEQEAQNAAPTEAMRLYALAREIRERRYAVQALAK